ncbi:MAG: transcriptional regulator [Hymenobacter sp.]|nr:MAG: transcriptional regulator [Hymenobacter sp.]
MKKVDLSPPPSAATLSDRLRRGDLLSAACPSRTVLQHLTSRWGLLVVLVLDGRTYRFSALRRAIDGVSERMLAQTLQALEADGLVLRVAYDVVPPHVEYCLTPLGQQAVPAVRALADWVETSFPAVAQHQARLANVAPPAGQ